MTPTATKNILQKIAAQPLPFILTVAVLLRVAIALAMGDTVVALPGIFDQVSYHNLALRVVGGHGFSFGELWWPITPADAPTAHWSFLYTLYLSLVYILFGPHPLAARIAQAVIVGVLHPYITFHIGEKLFSKTVGLVAAGITAVYVYFFYYGAALMTEPFYITAILFSLYFGIRLSENLDRKLDTNLGVSLGISLGITVLLRQVFLLFIPFLFLWIWIVRIRRRVELPLLPSLVSILLTIAFILPASLYNYSRFDRFVLLNTNSGYAFFWGNHPIHGTKFIPILPTETYQEMIPEEVRSLDEAALDQELLKRGIQFVTDDPGRYLLLSLSRIPPYFMFWYSADSSTLSNISRIGSFGLFLPFMLYGLWLSVKANTGAQGNRFLNLLFSPQGLLMLFAVVYSGVHILTWTLIRYRLPVDAVLIPFAGLALAELAQRILKTRPHLLRQFQRTP
ncbi:MAG: glycosyltransferase family 39 protein [Anaerolineae bacterium]|nr:glycosyltransferase family 39 protein [Anaerolineae bacterium]MBL8105425.1 glycosyltransferase family 39 protein [Anaerolineales bacterium]MCC7190078.1 glycosyltransferase family 39 protein [Anaerolineales bacterium]